MRREVLTPEQPVASSPILSFVVPAFNEEDGIADALRAIHEKAVTLVDSHEIILVDDGSKDDTRGRAIALCGEIPLRVICLSRNFGKEQALMAGLSAARGEAVVTLDADLQEPLNALDTMVAHWREGIAMVYAVRAHRRDETLSKRVGTGLFYWLLRAGNQTDIPRDARDFRLLDRRIVDVINTLPERNLFMKGIFGWVGFDNCAVPVELRPRRHGRSKFRFRGLLRLAVTALTSFTVWPLRVWTLIGMSIAMASIGYGSWIAVRTLIWGVELPGWSTLAVGTTLLGGIQLVSIGVLGEYVARIFTEVKGRLGYVIASEYSGNTPGS